MYVLAQTCSCSHLLPVAGSATTRVSLRPTSDILHPPFSLSRPRYQQPRPAGPHSRVMKMVVQPVQLPTPSDRPSPQVASVREAHCAPELTPEHSSPCLRYDAAGTVTASLAFRWLTAWYARLVFHQQLSSVTTFMWPHHHSITSVHQRVHHFMPHQLTPSWLTGLVS
jgi:hypothetical protein